MDNNWADRVREERTALTGKINRLTDFMVSEAGKRLSERHRTLLRNQLDVMGTYREILGTRLVLFGNLESQE